MCQVNEQMGSLGREIETIKKDRTEILEPESMVTEMNSHWISLTEDCRWPRKESLNLKIV